MILFPHLRTKRIAVKLREITMGEAIAVLGLPPNRHEATATEFLRRVADGAAAPVAGFITDPRLWTVEERARLVCHYLSQVSDSGADFAVGDSAVFSDYVQFEADLAVPEVELPGVAGADRVLRPLLGVHAEVLERMCTSRGDWLVGVLACQIQLAAEPAPNLVDMGDVELIEWAKTRMEALRALPESEFEELLSAWTAHRAQLMHFFDMDVQDEGVVFWPMVVREGGPTYPARFRALSCISPGTRRLFERPGQPGK